MKFHKKTKYLKKDDGTIYVRTAALAKRNDMKEFVPPSEKDEKVKKQPVKEQASEPEPVKPPENGAVTKEFLMTKTKEQLDDFCKKVFRVDLDQRKNKADMVEMILELQETVTAEEDKED